MRFKPFGSKYVFIKEALVETFPDYMKSAVANWLYDVLRYEVVEAGYDRPSGIKKEFQYFLQIEFRELFPSDWEEFMVFTFDNSERTCNIIALCLQNYAISEQASYLEYVLSQGGSAYEVTAANRQKDEFKGGYDLVMRVSVVVKKQARDALSADEMLKEAWNYCYSRHPDYERVVSKCCDFLEGLLGKRYFPKDPKPQLKKFVHSLEENPQQLRYKGDAIVEPKSLLTSLLKDASDIRGQHTRGAGREPTKDESEFVLHTTILIWNLHNGIT